VLICEICGENRVRDAGCGGEKICVNLRDLREKNMGASG